MKVPRGKYKDQEIEDVPSDYLRWALETWDKLSPAWIEEAEAQLRAREGEGIVRKDGRP